MSARSRHPNQDAAPVAAFKKLPRALTAHIAHRPRASRSRSSFRTKRGSGRTTGLPGSGQNAGPALSNLPLSAIRAPIFSAPAWAKEKGTGLALPFADTFAMQFDIDEIRRHVQRGAHAVLLLDRAGRHTTNQRVVSKNMTLILPPSRSPELNPVENVWQHLQTELALKTVSTPANP